VLINEVKKYVFSKSLEKAEWNNSMIMRDIAPDEIAALKNEAGKNIIIIGSGTIVSQLENAKLIDEYRFISMPVVLGEGKPYFRDLDDRVDLELVETRSFTSGNVLHRYHPKTQRSRASRDETV